MRAAILHAHAPITTNPLQLQEIEIPVPQKGEMRIKVRACGICRTDLHVIEGELATQRVPIIPGHQIVGVIDQLGPECKLFSLGERVGIAWLRSTCGSCQFCTHDQGNLCLSSQYTGYHADGGYAEYAVVNEAYAYKLPSELPDAEAAPLLCSGIVGYRALKRSNIKKGGKLAIFGFGSSAHIILQIALGWGCEIYVATRGEGHRSLAIKMGALWAGDSFERFPTKVDSAIVFAPVGQIVPAALHAVRSGGTVVCAGIHMSALPSMNYEECLFHEKELRSVEANTRVDGQELFKEAVTLGIHPKVKTFSLESVNEALIQLKSDAINGSGVILIS